MYIGFSTRYKQKLKENLKKIQKKNEIFQNFYKKCEN